MENTLLSQVTKTRLRTSIEVLSKEIISLKNKEMMIMVDQEIKLIINDVNKLLIDNKDYGIFIIDKVGSDAKAIKRVIEEIKTVSNYDL